MTELTWTTHHSLSQNASCTNKALALERLGRSATLASPMPEPSATTARYPLVDTTQVRGSEESYGT